MSNKQSLDIWCSYARDVAEDAGHAVAYQPAMLCLFQRDVVDPNAAFVAMEVVVPLADRSALNILFYGSMSNIRHVIVKGYNASIRALFGISHIVDTESVYVRDHQSGQYYRMHKKPVLEDRGQYADSY